MHKSWTQNIQDRNSTTDTMATYSLVNITYYIFYAHDKYMFT